MRRAHAAAHAEHRDARPDELQPGHRRHRQGSPGHGDRRAGRCHGARHRSCRHPVPHAQRQQGPGGARDARAGRSHALPAGRSVDRSRTSRTCRCSSRRSRTCASSGGRVAGVVTQSALEFAARAVVLTVGTFLGGRIHVGPASSRRADAPAIRRRTAWPQRLRELPLRVGRLKTGTPPRIDGRTHRLLRPAGAAGRRTARRCSRSSGAATSTRGRCRCHITATNERTHEIIRAGTDRSPMFTGVIEGVGPRYCPSVEDKVVRFADKSLAPDLHRAGRARHARDLPERHLDQPAVRRAAGIRAHHPRFRAGAHHAAGLRHRIRLLRPARPAAHARDQARRRACTSRARSTAPPATRKPPRRACSPASTPALRGAGARALVADARRRLHRRAGRRPDHARRTASPTACSPAARSTA